MNMTTTLGAALLLLGGFHAAASAQHAAPNSSDTTAYTVFGIGTGGFTNQGQFFKSYIVAAGTGGGLPDGVEYRSHLSFHLPDAASIASLGHGTRIVSARVELAMEDGIYASWASKPLTAGFFDVDQAHLPWLSSGGDAAQNLAIFNDLGSGQLFGSALVPVIGSAPKPLSIELSAGAVAEINARLGQSFALGVSTTDAGPNELFLLSRPSCDSTQTRCLNWEQRLVLTVSAVPEPTETTLMLIGLSVLVAWRKRSART